MSELDNIDQSADIITAEAAKQKEETQKLRNQNGDNNGRIDEAIQELETNAKPALQKARTEIDAAEASVDKALETLKKSPEPAPPGDIHYIEAVGGPEQQAVDFRNAVDKMMAGKTVVSLSPVWDLSNYTPHILEGQGFNLWQPDGQAVELNFGYKQLGAMWSLASGTRIRIKGVKANGYDRLFLASEDSSKTGYSGPNDSWQLFRDGAPPAMGWEWIEDCEFRDCIFEGPFFFMYTEPNSGYDSSKNYPGLRSLIVDNCTWEGYGGLWAAVGRFGDINITNCRGIKKSSARDLYVYPFYERFGINPRPGGYFGGNGALMTTTGEVQRYCRSPFKIGRGRNRSTNGKVVIRNSGCDWAYSDIVPREHKFNQDLDIHFADVIGSSEFIIEDCDINNVLDFSYTDANWARGALEEGSIGCEGVATQDDIQMRRVKVTNCGLGEGALIVHKGSHNPTGIVEDCEVVRDESLVGNGYRSLLNNYPDLKSSSGHVYLRPGEIPQPMDCALRLRYQGTMRRITARGYEVPVRGWDKFINWWSKQGGTTQVDMDTLFVYDKQGNQLHPN